MTIYKTATIELQDLAYLVDVQYGAYLRPSPVGIYCKDILEPLIVEGESYYCKVDIEGAEQEIPYTDFSKLPTSPVYKRIGSRECVVIHKRLIQRKLLSTEETLPFMAMHAVLLLVDDCIRQEIHSPYCTNEEFNLAGLFVPSIELAQAGLTQGVHRISPDTARGMLAKEGIKEAILGDIIFDEICSRLRNTCKGLIERVIEFISMYRYNTYRRTLLGTSLKLYQEDDYRALMWQSKQDNDYLLEIST
jgi:hypothetical protein